ncbi:MmyB family transcriptional regulator [Streptomyces cadmiisoli]|uniref:MmyB family transcriptional regulator n=1 Tax=Streptomyces cadmiisoli TaxID=2184053 RepID=UPI0036640906
MQDADFRRWWASHDVALRTGGTKLLHPPVAGDLTLDWEILTSATDPDQQLMVMTAEPGSPSHQAMSFFTSWTEATRSEASGRPS